MTTLTFDSLPGKIHHDTPGFGRVCVALILSGFSAFSALYCVQPILPVFVRDFAIPPASASLSLTFSTIALAIGLVFSGPVSDAYGRKPIMLFSMIATGVLMMATSLAPNWHALLALRIAIGLLLGGITAVNLTYLAEEVDQHSLGLAIGYVVAGNSIGGMVARVFVGVAADHMDWRWPITAVGVMSLVAAAVLWLWLPPSRFFRPSPLRIATTFDNFGRHLSSPGLAPAFLAGFLLMGCFVAFFNYIGFRLLAPPFELGQTVVGMISVVYLPASYAAVEAGKMSDHIGPEWVHIGAIGVMALGVALTAVPLFWILGLGTLLFTFGFFAAHSVAVGHVGRRAQTARAQATAMYQIAFYFGASIAGTVGGFFWQAYGWNGVLLLLGGMLALAALNGTRLK